MIPIFRFSILLLLAGLFTGSMQSCRQGTETQYVVILSMDAFRWDYPRIFDTPNLDLLEKEGVRAKSLVPCFPTKTFPNHYSMATGLHPDHHGIVQNSFYDPAMDAWYRIGDRDAVENGDFYGGEPIWVTAEKQGIPTASYFWVGSEAPVQGIQPSTWKKYEHDFPFEARIDSVISWLQRPENTRPRLIAFYFHEPDSKAHDLGPENPVLGLTISYLDSLVGDLMVKLDALDMAGRINLIISSDHGMGPVSPTRYTDLADFIKPGWTDVVQGYNPNYLVRAAKGCYDSILCQLDKIPHVSGWAAGDVPERFVYGTHPRTLDFVFLADSAWSIGWQKEANPGSLGGHGFDNRNTDMHGIFYARGPAFRHNYTHPAFQNTDLYPLIAHILNLKPAKTDGDVNNVRSMLSDVK